MNNFIKWLNTYKPFNSRRFMLSVLGIICLTILGLVKGMSVAEWIAGICMGLSAANAWQKPDTKEETITTTKTVTEEIKPEETKP
jgi:hypothetical protein